MNQNKLPASPPMLTQQQQQLNQTSPRNVNVVGSNTASTAPLPTQTLLSQNLTTIESKATQLQQLNKDIYQLLKITTPPNNKDTLSSIDEYEKNIKLLNQYRINVFGLIKELQQDISNQNIPLNFLTPILNDQQDVLFYDPPQPTTTIISTQTTTTETGGEPITTDSSTSMDTSSNTSITTKLTPEQHNIKLFNEKFQQHLTAKTIQDQSTDWDVVGKDKDKLAKNADRVKFTIFNDKNR